MFASDLAVSIPQAGLLVTGYALGVVIGAPILAVLTAGLPRRPTLIALASLFTAGNLLCALAPSYDLLMAARVLTALSHGTFFGIGSVVAAALVQPQRRSQAIALMFTGLTLANVLGAVLLPRRIAGSKASLVKEFVALRDPRVLLALLTSVLCSASLFCVFTYITPTLTEVSGFSAAAVAPILLLFGVGLTVGSTLGGKLGDRQLVPSILLIIAANAGVLTLIKLVSATRIPMIGMLFIWGTLAFALVPLLQTLIVHHAEAAPNLASTLNQAAFNLGNAIGAWIGSRLLSAGVPLAELSWGSVALTLGALVLATWGSLLGASGYRVARGNVR